MHTIGQFIGFVAIFVSLFIYTQSNRKKIIIFKLFADLLWALHFFLIGTLTGSATTGISVIREFFFIKFKRNKWMLIVFPTVYLISLILTYKNWTSFFPALASTLATIGFCSKNVNIIKLLNGGASTLMLAYGICNSSYATMINESFVLISIAVSYFKVVFGKSDRNLQSEEKNKTETMKN